MTDESKKNGNKVDIEKVNQRYLALKNERSPWDTAWRDLADHFCPTRFRADSDSSDRKPEILNRNIVDTTGLQDMRTLAAGMQGGMTSPARPWFTLGLENEKAAKAPEAGAWLDEVTKRMRSLLHSSNYYSMSHMLYSDLGTFGVGLMIETADWDGLHFKVIPAGEYVLDTDDKGDVDTFMYRTRMSARQIIKKFGEDVVPSHVKTAASNSGSAVTSFFDVIHAVFPRSERTFGRLDSLNMPWASVWWLGFGNSGGGKPCVLRESGFKSFPAFAPRWGVTGNDKYGRSPAMDTLPDCRMLQQMGKTSLRGFHKSIDPPVAVPSSLQNVGVDLTPAGVNYMSMDGPEKGSIEAIQTIPPQVLVAAEQKIEKVQQKVHDGLFADLFKMLMLNDRRQITATEIEAREREKLMLLGPVVERVNNEYLARVIMRTFQLMADYDHLPEQPDSIVGQPLRIEFVSVMAQAQKLVSTSSIDQTFAFVANLAQAKPDVLDIFDCDYAAREYAEDVGAPAALMLPEGQVQQTRAARAQAQQQAAAQAQQQAAMQQAVDLTGAAKNLGQTPLGADGQTAMDALMGGMGKM